jgi:hypothetical protein
VVQWQVHRKKWFVIVRRDRFECVMSKHLFTPVQLLQILCNFSVHVGQPFDTFVCAVEVPAAESLRESRGTLLENLIQNIAVEGSSFSGEMLAKERYV